MKKFLVMLSLLAMTSMVMVGCLGGTDEVAPDPAEETPAADVEPVVEEEDAATEDAEEAEDAEETEEV